MKKTLITAAFVAGLVASSIATATDLTLDSALIKQLHYDGTTSFHNDDLITETTHWNNDRNYTYAHATVMMVLDWEKLSNTLTSTPTLLVDFRQTSATTTTSSIGATMYTSGDSVLGKSSWQGGSWGNVTASDVSGNVQDGLFVLTLSLNGNNGAHSYFGGIGDSSVDASTLKAGDAHYEYLYINSDIKDSIVSLYVFNQSLTDAQVTALSADALDAVPEPATATLSLLALAGLAARRRRK